MIEILASLVVGALVVEWWQIYHGEPPTPPAASAPPAPRPVARAPVVMPAEIAAAPVAAAPAPMPAAATPAPARTKPVRPRTPVAPATSMPVTAAEEVATAEPPAPLDDAPAAPAARLADAELAARAREFTAEQDHIAAAADWTELLRRDPANPDARRALVFALQTAGLPERALGMANAAPALFSKGELAMLHADVADEAIALAIRGEPRPERNHVLRERANAALDSACRYADENTVEAARNRCASLRVTYLSGVGLHRAAADAYGPASDRVDDDAHTAAAHSLLALARVDEADRAFARRSATADADTNFASERLFVRERLRDGSASIDARIATTPTHNASADGSVKTPNWDRVILESERLRALAWRGRLKEAIAGQQDLVAGAPGDVDLRLQLAQFYRYDGHRDLADRELRKAEALSPAARGVLEARIAFATEDGEYQDARRDLVTLRDTWPADDAAWNLQREYHLASSPWIEASISSTRSDGPGLVTANDELQQEVAFYGHAWEKRGDTRLFVFEQGDVGEYDTETSNPFRAGVGVMTRHRDWDARASVHARRGTPEDAVGATLAGHVRFSDHWEADVTLQSDNAPLLALENGIDAWSVDAGVQYNVHDGHYYRLDARESGYDDGNESLSLGLTGRQRLYADAPHYWSLIERLETTENELTAVPYFSPERMSAAELQLEYRGVLHALGPVRWEHSLTLGAGLSDQEGFGNDTIGDLRWEHVWTPHERLELGAGIELRRRVYDGTPEDQREFFASLLWRLP